MLLTKYTHACVTLETDGGVVLIDPGIWAEDAAFARADSVLITHEHFDHIDHERLGALVARQPGLEVRAPEVMLASLADSGITAIAVASGDAFEAAGLAVDVVGGLHAEIIDNKPGCANVGYVVAGSVYHPGDALHVPDVPIQTLLVPTCAPWLKLSEAIEFMRAVTPVRAISIHDAMFSDKGPMVIDPWLDGQGGAHYSRLSPGSILDLA